MFQITINDHLYLRMLSGRDALPLFQLTDNSRDYLRAWLPWLDQTKSMEDSLTFIKDNLLAYEQKKALTAGIFFHDDLAGVISFNTIDVINNQAEIGYWLGESYQGNGIMLKSTAALITYGFTDLQLNRITIECATENVKSQSIPERLQFTKEGRLRQVSFLYDQYVDHFLYSMLAEEWHKLSTENPTNE